jgi:hypothetical protein
MCRALRPRGVCVCCQLPDRAERKQYVLEAQGLLEALDRLIQELKQ